MDERVEQAVALALSKQQGAGAQADVVISLVSQRCSSYASTATTGDEPQENMPAVDTERYLVDYITMQTPCELHVKAKTYHRFGSLRVSLTGDSWWYDSWKVGTPGYSIATMEQIVEANGENEKLKLDFVGGDGEKTLGETLHGVILWHKAYITLIGNTAAPVDPPSPPDIDNNDGDFVGGPSSPPPRPPSPSPPRVRSNQAPAPGKGKKQTSSLPPARTPKKAEDYQKENRP
ncbi:hypothetical protein GQ55_6G084000 [Panicum hallii var. hallii]|uniref:DUF8039 domain-containing protein n=1 Tax=Panicum hallii var. hallii TaxID=1504633 RepID=A0A2T7D576_9POAL|nr:hypothetical protein GQ55_6G084000 [Panicum hallii var. hallii]